MIDLVRKIQGSKTTAIKSPKRKVRKYHHPVFSKGTIKMLRCVIDNPGLNIMEVLEKTGSSFNFISYSLMKFCDIGILHRTRGSIGSKGYRYRVLLTKESAIAIADREELKLNTLVFSKRMDDIFDIINKSGRCTVLFVAGKLELGKETTHSTMTKMLNAGRITRGPSQIKGSRFEYMIKVAA